MQHDDTLVVKKQRVGPRQMTSQNLKASRSMSILSPTQEENSNDNEVRLRNGIISSIGSMRNFRDLLTE